MINSFVVSCSAKDTDRTSNSFNKIDKYFFKLMPQSGYSVLGVNYENNAEKIRRTWNEGGGPSRS